MINRRVMALGLGTVWASAAVAQVPGRTYRVAYFGVTAYNSPDDERLNAAFVNRLGELGFVEGKNLIIEWRYAEGHNERYADFAKEMAAARADLVVTAGAVPARAVVAASKTLPVVTFGMPDPVSTGLVASLAHPGGQVTGLSNFAADLVPKRIELFKAAVPSLRRLAFARCPECGRLSGYSPTLIATSLTQYQTQARQLGMTLIEIPVNAETDFPAAVQAIKRERVEGVLLAATQINSKLRRDWVALQEAQRLPLMADYRGSGALISYGPDYAALFRRMAEYSARV